MSINKNDILYHDKYGRCLVLDYVSELNQSYVLSEKEMQTLYVPINEFKNK